METRLTFRGSHVCFWTQTGSEHTYSTKGTFILEGTGTSCPETALTTACVPPSAAIKRSDGHQQHNDQHVASRGGRVPAKRWREIREGKQPPPRCSGVKNGGVLSAEGSAHGGQCQWNHGKKLCTKWLFKSFGNLQHVSTGSTVLTLSVVVAIATGPVLGLDGTTATTQKKKKNTGEVLKTRRLPWRRDESDNQ